MDMIISHGHTKPIREVKFNQDGDLLFSASEDSTVTVWSSVNGERLGTFRDHTGAVMDIDIDFKSELLITGSGDGRVILWEVETGKKLGQVSFEPELVRAVDFSFGDTKFLAATRPLTLSNPSRVHVCTNPAVPSEDVDAKSDDHLQVISSMRLSKNRVLVNRAKWSPLNDEIFAVCDDGTIRIFDVVKEKEKSVVVFDPFYERKRNTVKNITPSLTSIKYCNDLGSVIISSRNTEAKIFDIKDWSTIATYETNRGLNGASVHPQSNAIIIGGGKAAVEAALDKKEGRYECLVYHKLYEERMGIIPVDSISPLNCMEFCPDGSCAALGYVEGQVRIYRFSNEFTSKFQAMEKRFIAEVDEEDSDEEY